MSVIRGSVSARPGLGLLGAGAGRTTHPIEDGQPIATLPGFDYRPLVGPSVWIKLPNRDPKKLGALQRFDRTNLEKLKERVANAELRLKQAEEAEKAQKAEAAKVQAAKHYLRVSKPGTRVTYRSIITGKSQFGTVVAPSVVEKTVDPYTRSIVRRHNDDAIWALWEDEGTVGWVSAKDLTLA